MGDNLQIRRRPITSRRTLFVFAGEDGGREVRGRGVGIRDCVKVYLGTGLSRTDVRCVFIEILLTDPRRWTY